MKSSSRVSCVLLLQILKSICFQRTPGTRFFDKNVWLYHPSFTFVQQRNSSILLNRNMNNNRIDLNILKKTMSSLQKDVDAADSVGGLQFSWKYLVFYFSIIFMNFLHFTKCWNNFTSFWIDRVTLERENSCLSTCWHYCSSNELLLMSC